MHQPPKTVVFKRSGLYANATVSLPHFKVVAGEPIELDGKTAERFLGLGVCEVHEEPPDAAPTPPDADTNKNGYLSVAELKAAITKAGKGFTVGAKRAELLAIYKAL